MHNNNRSLLKLLAVTLLLAGCAHRIERGGFDTCTFGHTCTLGGKLELFSGEPAGSAVMSDGNQCAKLALPDEFYTDPLRKRWHKQAVRVEGRAFAQPSPEGNVGVLSWYAEKDRRIATGMCDQGVGIYVDTLQSSSGEVWPDR